MFISKCHECESNNTKLIKIESSGIQIHIYDICIDCGAKSQTVLICMPLIDREK